MALIMSLTFPQQRENIENRKSVYGLEWVMVQAFTHNRSPEDCIEMLLETEQSMMAILRSLQKCRSFRCSPTHTRDYQQWRWWTDRFEFKLRWVQATGQADKYFQAKERHQ